jgi:hypothetical protein
METPLIFIFSRIKIAKMAMLSKVIYRFSAISIEFPMPFFTEIENQTQILIEAWKIPNGLYIPEQKKQCCKYHSTNFKLYYRDIVTKVAWYWHKNTHID